VLGAELLVRAPTSARREQDEAHVTYAHKIAARDRALDPTPCRGGGAPRARCARTSARASRCPTAARRDRGERGPDARLAGGLLRTEGERLLLDRNGGALS
jgi:hypothetical protein